MVGSLLQTGGLSERDAFWLVRQLVRREGEYGLDRLYAPGLPLLMHWLGLLELALAVSLPALWAHLRRLDIGASFFATPWFVTLFCSTKCLCGAAVRWAWDQLLLARAGKGAATLMVLSVALAILRQVECEIELGVTDFEGTMAALQTCGGRFKAEAHCSSEAEARRQEAAACALLQGHVAAVGLSARKVASWEKQLAKMQRQRKKTEREEGR